MDQMVKPKSKLKQEDLQPIIDLLNKYYDGNLLLLTKWLDRSIYVLHFFSEDDSLTELQRQNICFALMGLKECLMEIHFKENDWEYVQFK